MVVIDEVVDILPEMTVNLCQDVVGLLPGRSPLGLGANIPPEACRHARVKAHCLLACSTPFAKLSEPLVPLVLAKRKNQEVFLIW